MHLVRTTCVPSAASHRSSHAHGYDAPRAVHSAANKVFRIHNLTDEEATLVEPTACAIHGLDKLAPAVGIDVLIIGAGPTGLILAQLLKQNGAARVVIAANKGIKTETAKRLGAGDEYVELDRQSPEAQWDKLRADNPYGFDVVVSSVLMSRPPSIRRVRVNRRVARVLSCADAGVRWRLRVLRRSRTTR